MPEQLLDPWLAAFAVTLFLASLATWMVLFGRLVQQGAILRYEPRRTVPWGVEATLLAIVFLGLVAFQAFVVPERRPPEPPDDIPNALQLMERIGSMILLQTIVVTAFAAFIVATSRARLADLGLPEYADEVANDIAIGFVAWLAAIVPVYTIQAVVVTRRADPERITEHPLIEMVLREPAPGVLILAFVAAIVVAPIAEEIVFRLFLQGWLEKWEDRQVGWRQPKPTPEPMFEVPPADYRATEELADAPNTLPANGELATEETPPRRGLAGLPHGWVPILISAAMFSLAHLGHGPDPIPLLPLAIILGYTYQRTHRIIPCIVTHFLFNATSMLVLWRVISLHEAQGG